MQTIEMEVVGQRVRLAESRAMAGVDAPAVVLVHGAGHDHSVWQDVTPLLAAAGLRVIGVPESPGVELPGADRVVASLNDLLPLDPA